MIDKFEIVECRKILVTVLENFWNDSLIPQTLY